MNKTQAPTQGKPEHADEKTQRRVAESEIGGVSSEESARRYERGENPGGTHQNPPAERSPVEKGEDPSGGKSGAV